MIRSESISFALCLLALGGLGACVDDSSAAQAGGRQTRGRQTRRTRPATPKPQAKAPARAPRLAPAPETAAASTQYAVRSTQRSSDSLRFVEHADYIRPGLAAANRRAMLLRNPYEGDRQATTVGSQLFMSYNCVDCHGMDGSGAMGPSLADGRWHFGGTPGEVFESIYQGRPEGMPAWGGRISDADIWRLVTYVRSLQAGKDVATENFTGKAQQRMGH
jgi:cytochrome c oxidase cbb3-type subunit 3